MRTIAIASALAFACLAQPALACRMGRAETFPSWVKFDKSVVVFRLDSLSVVGPGPDYSEAAGRIRLKRTHKGPASGFQYIRVPVGFCGLRMQVGDFYVAATSQQGPVLDIRAFNGSVFGLGMQYQVTNSNQENDRRRILGEVQKILKTGKASPGFPDATDLELFPALPPPPPPPMPPDPKR
jgi:hypothetical protein